MPQNICVFCASSNRIDPKYFEVASELGRHLARRGDRLVFGGGQVGLMGATARGVHELGGHVTGIIPKGLMRKEVTYEASDELVITEGLNDRKDELIARSDAFLILPGGYGTLDEFFEVLTQKQLAYHHKPIVILNVAGFFDPFLQLMDYFAHTQFVRPDSETLYHVADTISNLFAYLDAYAPAPPQIKWE